MKSIFQKKTYSEQVAEYIRRQILNGRFEPGTPVKELVVAEELGISRAPVREAMQTLVREGLIDAAPQKRKVVRSMTALQIRNSYFAGGVLEAAAVAQVIDSFTEEDLAALQDVIDSMKFIAETSGNVSEMAPLDTAFHDILFSRVENELLIDICKKFCQGISKYLLFKHWIKLFPAEKVYLRHKIVLDAVRRGDPAEVELVIRQHYEESGKKMARFGSDR
ncbi:MAG: GntR family transcriptional regulator [Desulfobacterales bacterium]|nr:MAG: GntR family transcriptional regulator [Desulfobacterales bacterium]